MRSSLGKIADSEAEAERVGVVLECYQLSNVKKVGNNTGSRSRSRMSQPNKVEPFDFIWVGL